MASSTAADLAHVGTGPHTNPDSESPTFVVSEPPERTYVRTSVTAIRLVGWLVVLGFAYLALRGVPDSNFQDSFGEFLASVPRWLVSGIVGFVGPQKVPATVSVAIDDSGTNYSVLAEK